MYFFAARQRLDSCEQIAFEVNKSVPNIFIDLLFNRSSIQKKPGFFSGEETNAIASLRGRKKMYV